MRSVSRATTTAVIESGNNGADIDYGPRGPQHRPNMLLRPAT